MTWSLLVLCAAATAVIAFSVSAAVGAGLAGLRRRLDGLTAAAEARVLFGLTLLPMLLSAALMTAAMAPNFGWIVDHCSVSMDPHAHPHICTTHHVSTLPAATLLALAALFLVRLGASAVRALRSSVAALVTVRALSRASTESGPQQVRVLPLDEPLAFVVGALRPVPFITRGLLSDEHREHLAPALSHERAHMRRRDSLRRLVASFALGFHLPGIASWLERRLARAHEIAADAEAAGELQSPERVAWALVCLTRAQKRVPAAGMAFGGSDVEVRVATLLDRRQRRDGPGKVALLSAVTILFAAVAASADAVHHGVEIVLGLLGG